MRKALLISGIALIVLGVFSLLIAFLFWFAFSHTLDGSNDFYHKRFKLFVIFLLIGLALTILGIVCLLWRRKLPK